MTYYLKISSYLVVLLIGIKFRTCLWNKLRSIRDNGQQIVLFFPETKIQSKDFLRQNYNVVMSANPSSVLYQLMSALKSSRDSLDICLFNLSFEPIIQLIQDLSQSGINVRIITNSQNGCEAHVAEEAPQKSDQLEPLLQLFRFGVELKFISLSEDGLMHNKFAIIDNKLLINGSLNWTEASIFSSYNDCILTTDPKLVLTFLRHFNDFWSLN